MTYIDKNLCLKCQYHGYLGSKSDSYGSNRNSNVMCDYAKYVKRTCLRKVGVDVIDMRGTDPKHCKLFVKGPRLGDK